MNLNRKQRRTLKAKGVSLSDAVTRETAIKQEYMQKVAQIGDLTLQIDAMESSIARLKADVKALNEEYSALQPKPAATEATNG